MTTLVVLIEQPIEPRNVEQVVALGESDDLTVHIVMATSSEAGPVATVVDEIATLGTFEGTTDEPRTDLDASVHRLQDAGVAQVTGELSGPDVLGAVKAAALKLQADQIWVLTPVHFLEDSLHMGWADELRRTSDIPVLHVESGTDRILG